MFSFFSRFIHCVDFELVGVVDEEVYGGTEDSGWACECTMLGGLSEL